MESEKSKSTDQACSNESDLFSLTRCCGFALARIEKAVVTLGETLTVEERKTGIETIHHLQEKVGGVILRHFFSSSIQLPSTKEVGEIGIDLAAVRREMDDKMKHIQAEREKERKELEMEKETARKAEEERQREFSRKMREMEEMKRMNEKWIEEGRQREEEKKREEERKRKEEKRRRRATKECERSSSNRSVPTRQVHRFWKCVHQKRH
ncbi:hypothetical protein BLNAU_12125 [Blattamonas nauphoetae]|uniref:Uncharacterized protein n=1 Tax=Blattamonas nauphoetae TaxID=2049346 RepID=A0ABQ9XN45_9EUKA|nr:hypothetical protein BLNAU_12125 [Blattamonas nauphoetae]